MYSNQNIPAPFARPCRNNHPTGNREQKAADERPTPKKESVTNDAVILAKEKTLQKKTTSAPAAPLLAVLLYDLFSKQKE